jgi:ABC-2 type transport system permease protein
VSIVVTALLCWAFSALILEMIARDPGAIAPAEILVVLLTKSPFGPLMAGLIGVLGTGNEYRHGTIRTTLTVIPRRSKAFGAKVISVGLCAAVIAVANLAASWAVVLLVLPGKVPVTLVFSPVVRAQFGALVFVVGWGLIGVALGILVRSQTGAILLLIALPFVLEPALRASLGASSQKSVAASANYLPFSAGSAMMGGDTSSATILTEGGSRLGPAGGAVAFLAFVAVLLATAGILFNRRDA